MTERQSNNKPWVILGGISCLLVLGFLGYGVMSGIKSVQAESSILTDEQESQTDFVPIMEILVDQNQNIFIDGESVASVKEAEALLRNSSSDLASETPVLLRLNTSVRHSTLIILKTALQETGYPNQIEIIRNDQISQE